jgi:hypothetical protein
MSTRLYRDLFQYITKYALNLTTRATPSAVHFSDHYMFATRSSAWPAQVAIHRTVEINFDIQRTDEEQPHCEYTRTVRSQAELEIIAAERQMKDDFKI